MIDIYLINTVINIIWYIFSILFVLYKFTSFFSYIYNFGKFLGRLTQGLFYIKNRILEFIEQRENQYITRPTSVQSQSIFTRIKNKITCYFWGEPKEQVVLPMYTRVSDGSFDLQNKKKDLHFENCINELMTPSNTSSFVSIDLSNSKNKKPNNYDSNYESYFYNNYHTSNISHENIDNELCVSETDLFIKKDIESEPKIINTGYLENNNYNYNENVKQRFNIEDSNMLFNSNFIKNTLNS